MIKMKNVDAKKLFKTKKKNVKYYRKLYNLKTGKMTQENLAEAVDVCTALIGNLESEHIEQGISVYTLWKISQILEIPVEKLFDTSDFKTRKID